jgi:hypothetical protein
MNKWSMIIAASNIGAGLVFILISLPLLKGKIPMNYFYGMRIRRAFESDENWYRINRYGARQLILWSIPVILTGVAALFIPFDEQKNLPLILLFAPAVAALASAFVTYRYARTL